MRKSLIAQSVATLVGTLGLAAAANAAVVAPPAATPVAGVPEATVLQVNTDGLGHINLVPYYSVAGGNDTYINISNTDTKNGKAVKVRFRGASNSDDVFDITVLMSPGDNWSAAITKGADGTPTLTHSDKTCTLPANVKQNFVLTRLDPSAKTDPAENLAEQKRQASEGYVEILNMADIPYNAGPGAAGVVDSLYEAIKHVNGTAPCTPSLLAPLFNDSTSYAGAQAKGLEVPTTGLMTNWTIINVPKATSFTGSAVAVEARVAMGGRAGWGNIVLFPQSAEFVPAGNVNLYTADPLLRSANVAGPAALPVIAAANFDFPDLSTPYTISAFGNPLGPLAQASELTRALAVLSTTNEYVTDQTIKAQSAWVFSMPTRRYNAAFNYAGTSNAQRLALTDLAAAVPLGRNYFTTANTTVQGRQLCVGQISTGEAISASGIAEPTNRHGAVTADREERFASSTDFVISPGEPRRLTFCGEVSVLGFNGSNPLAAVITKKDITVPYVDGWMRIATPGLGASATTGAGLPIIGDLMTELVNSAVAAGTAGNYGQTFPHRHTRP